MGESEEAKELCTRVAAGALDLALRGLPKLEPRDFEFHRDEISRVLLEQHKKAQAAHLPATDRSLLPLAQQEARKIRSEVEQAFAGRPPAERGMGGGPRAGRAGEAAHVPPQWTATSIENTADAVAAGAMQEEYPGYSDLSTHDARYLKTELSKVLREEIRAWLARGEKPQTRLLKHAAAGQIRIWKEQMEAKQGTSKSPSREAASASEQKPPTTRLVSILFMDLSGWSRLGAAQIAKYVDNGLPKLDQVVRKRCAEHLNTWGDALVATFDSARKAAECALDIRDFFRRTPEAEGVPVGLTPRISLHVGEVFVAHNPLLGRTDIFGDAVHLAARLEPVTAQGQVYCTADFATRLREIQGFGATAHRIGPAQLPKGFGVIDVYVVTGPGEAPPIATPPSSSPCTPQESKAVGALSEVDRRVASALWKLIDSKWLTDWHSYRVEIPQYEKKQDIHRVWDYLQAVQRPELSFGDEVVRGAHGNFVAALHHLAKVASLQMTPDGESEYVVSVKKAEETGWYPDDYEERYDRQCDALKRAREAVWNAWASYVEELRIRFPEILDSAGKV